VKQEACAHLLQEFFAERRRAKSRIHREGATP
jgi:hypothetical protein